MLYLLSGALVVVIIVLGAYIWRQQSKPEGVELKIDDNGISIQKN
jgi:RsiW-degrading membrane proteinase PrsW (M82 family)